jgi:hypothetical protein
MLSENHYGLAKSVPLFSFVYRILMSGFFVSWIQTREPFPSIRRDSPLHTLAYVSCITSLVL